MSTGQPTGERVSTPTAGFNPTWQRHVAAYGACAPFLPPGRVLDLGCGVGHSFELLAPRETVGVDIDPGCLEGQRRETQVADMRALPFGDHSFASVVCVQAIEHVPDPERVLAEAARVLEPQGVAVFVTPNRLTFGRPDEIIDPYHFVELDQHEMLSLLELWFSRVEMYGLFGSPDYMRIQRRERRELDRVLRRDPLRLRRLLPRSLRRRLYDRKLATARAAPDPESAAIATRDFELREGQLELCLDLVGVCRRPRAT